MAYESGLRVYGSMVFRKTKEERGPMAALRVKSGEGRARTADTPATLGSYVRLLP